MATDQPTIPKPKQTVTPWTATTSEDGMDYGKLVKDWGCSLIQNNPKSDRDLLKEIQQLTGKKVHHFLTRDIFYSHRDLENFLDHYKAGKPVYLYTGRGASSGSLHLGHLLPFLFTKYLQDAFDCPLVIQLTDDEKFLWKDMTLEDAKKYMKKNVIDIIACGFDIKKTFIFNNIDYIQQMYPTVLSIQKKITYSQAKATFGFEGSTNIGKISFPAIQAAPCFPKIFPSIFGNCLKDVRCMIPCGIDQDPYFRMTRDIAPKLKAKKPALLHGKFLPSLKGASAKMSSSTNEGAVFVDDTPKRIKKAINRAYSGAPKTLEEHNQRGANLQVDVAFQYLTYFLEDDVELNNIAYHYGPDSSPSERWGSGKVKGLLIEILQKLVKDFQHRRTLVTEEMINEFMRPRALEWNMNGKLLPKYIAQIPQPKSQSVNSTSTST